MRDADHHSELERRLGHRFSAPGLLRRALTHPSSTSGTRNAYERLEFLGDRVLGLVIAEQLLERFSGETEGEISRRFAQLVSVEPLSGVARDLDLGRFLAISPHRRHASLRTMDGVLADAMEAMIAALYLDGGLDVARRFVLRHWSSLIERADNPPVDPKSALQEWAQARKMQTPCYEVLDQTGPAHSPVFTIQVTLGDLPPRSATGPSKRKAEQTAAELMLAALPDAEKRTVPSTSGDRSQTHVPDIAHPSGPASGLDPHGLPRERQDDAAVPADAAPEHGPGCGHRERVRRGGDRRRSRGQRR